MYGILIGDDERIASWAFTHFQRIPVTYNRVLGIVDNDDGVLVGAILFTNYNGYNVELRYYGPWTLTLGIVRVISKIVVHEFNASRMTVLTSKKNKRLMRSLQRFGFKLEGVQRCQYGIRDCSRNTAVRFVAFRDQIERVAGVPQAEVQKQQG